jgi:antitoxin HigA-1
MTPTVTAAPYTQICARSPYCHAPPRASEWRILADLRIPPGNRLEKLAGDRAGEVHPGEILLEEFLEPLGVSQYQLAKEIGVPGRRINEIVHGQRRISADIALRLARFFGTSERFWINLQSRYDLEVEKDRLGTALEEIRPLTAVR